MHERDDLRALVDQLVDVGEVEPTVVGDAEPAQRRAGALAQDLPRHDVGVVLHLGDDDLVAGLQRASSPRQDVRDQVQRLGGVLGEDDRVGVGCADERGHLEAGALVGSGRLLTQRVRRAVDVGVVLLVELGEGVEHLARLLRGVRTVEIDQRLVVVNAPLEDREVLAQQFDVVAGVSHRERPPHAVFA